MMNRADRKKQLIAQGALYRAELLLARQATQASLQPDVLAKSALHRITLAALAMFGKQSLAGLTGGNLQTVLPMLLAGASALSKRRNLLKPVLLAAAVAGVVALVMKKKRAGHAAVDSDFAGPE